MCVPTNLGNAFSAISSVVGTINEYNTIRKNNEYRTEVAINNAKIAQNEALRQKQLGIEKARIETMEGMKNASRLKAKNAASNLDFASFTSELGYNDILNNSFSSANSIEKQYDNTAQNYFNQANNYLSQANNYKNLFDNSITSYSMNALGKFGKVSSNWFESNKKQQEGGFLNVDF